MRAEDAPGFDNYDRDLILAGITGKEKVTIGTFLTALYYDEDDPYVEEYRLRYRQMGVKSLPPVWVWDDGDLITGRTRLTAAHLLGIGELPAIIVSSS